MGLIKVSATDGKFFFEKLTQKSGRSLGFITGLEEDNHGFLWIATRNGLYRYDGYHYHQFQPNTDSLDFSFNDITYLYKDKEGILWLRHYDQFLPVKNESIPDEFTALTKENFELNAKLIEDQNNHIWAGPSENGLVRFNKKTKKKQYFQYKPLSYHPDVFDIIKTLKTKKDSAIKGLLKMNNNADTSLTFVIKKKSRFLINCTGEERNGKLYDLGFLKKDDGTILWKPDATKIKHAGGHPCNFIQSDIIELNPGRYHISYQTDAFHAYNNWSDEKPTKTEDYGIFLFPLNTEESKQLFQKINNPYHEKYHISTNQFTDMCINHSGQPSLIHSKGVEIYNPLNNQFILHKINYNKIFNATIDPHQLIINYNDDGHYRIGTNKGLIVMDTALRVQKVIRSDSLGKEKGTSSPISAIHKDNKKRLWLGSSEGLTIIEDKTGNVNHISATNKNRLYGNTITTIYEDKDNNIWFGSQSGLNKLVKNKFELISLEKERYSAYPSTLANEEDFWFRSNRNYLSRINLEEKSITNFQIPDTLFHYNKYYRERDYFFNDIHFKNKKNILIAIDNQIIIYNSIKKKTEQVIKLPAIQLKNNTAKNKVHSVFQDQHGMFVAFCINGVYIIDPEEMEIKKPALFSKDKQTIEQLDDHYIKYIHQRTDDNFWIRTTDGIFRYNNHKKHLELIYPFDQKIKHSELVDGNIAANGQDIWFAIMPRLIKIKPGGKIETYTHQTSGDVGACHVKIVEEKIWIYSRNGLFSFDTNSQTFGHYTYNDGLVSNNINNLISDRHNKLWITSINGLSKFHTDIVKFENLFRPFDTRPYTFLPPYFKFQQPKNKKILFTSKGLLVFRPHQLNNRAPEVKIISAKLFGEELQTDTLIYRKKGLELDHHQNFLAFSFSSLDFTKPENNRYKYILKGLDIQWKEVSANDRSANYTDLKPGEYTFIVKGSNSNGIWNQEGTRLYITIHPPWYKTIGAYISYVLLIVLGFYLFVKIREQKLIKEKQKLEKTVTERTKTITKQKEEIEQHKGDIEDSIKYASKIQEAILPPGEIIKQYAPESFLLFKPKDIVSGDFYFVNEIEGKPIIVAADCTGHGVPGAFMSMLGTAFLTEIISKKQVNNAGELLNQLREKVIQALHQTTDGYQAKDGMDLALFIIHPDHKIEFAGANNPLVIIRNGEIIEYKGDRMPIGIYLTQNKPFTSHLIEVEKDDMVYVFSDGYQDQFGGPEGKKFKYKKLKYLLADIYQKPMEEQKEILNQQIMHWMAQASVEQIDDIILIGTKIY